MGQLSSYQNNSCIEADCPIKLVQVTKTNYIHKNSQIKSVEIKQSNLSGTN